MSVHEDSSKSSYRIKRGSQQYQTEGSNFFNPSDESSMNTTYSQQLVFFDSNQKLFTSESNPSPLKSRRVNPQKIHSKNQRDAQQQKISTQKHKSKSKHRKSSSRENQQDAILQQQQPQDPINTYNINNQLTPLILENSQFQFQQGDNTCSINQSNYPSQDQINSVKGIGESMFLNQNSHLSPDSNQNNNLNNNNKPKIRIRKSKRALSSVHQQIQGQTQYQAASCDMMKSHQVSQFQSARYNNQQQNQQEQQQQVVSKNQKKSKAYERFFQSQQNLDDYESMRSIDVSSPEKQKRQKLPNSYRGSVRCLTIQQDQLGTEQQQYQRFKSPARKLKSRHSTHEFNNQEKIRSHSKNNLKGQHKIMSDQLRKSKYSITQMLEGVKIQSDYQRAKLVFQESQKTFSDYIQYLNSTESLEHHNKKRRKKTLSLHQNAEYTTTSNRTYKEITHKQIAKYQNLQQQAKQKEKMLLKQQQQQLYELQQQQLETSASTQIINKTSMFSSNQTSYSNHQIKQQKQKRPSLSQYSNYQNANKDYATQMSSSNFTNMSTSNSSNILTNYYAAKNKARSLHQSSYYQQNKNQQEIITNQKTNNNNSTNANNINNNNNINNYPNFQVKVNGGCVSSDDEGEEEEDEEEENNENIKENYKKQDNSIIHEQLLDHSSLTTNNDIQSQNSIKAQKKQLENLQKTPQKNSQNDSNQQKEDKIESPTINIIKVQNKENNTENNKQNNNNILNKNFFSTNKINLNLVKNDNEKDYTKAIIKKRSSVSQHQLKNIQVESGNNTNKNSKNKIVIKNNSYKNNNGIIFRQIKQQQQYSQSQQNTPKTALNNSDKEKLISNSDDNNYSVNHKLKKLNQNQKRQSLSNKPKVWNMEKNLTKDQVFKNSFLQNIPGSINSTNSQLKLNSHINNQNQNKIIQALEQFNNNNKQNQENKNNESDQPEEIKDSELSIQLPQDEQIDSHSNSIEKKRKISIKQKITTPNTQLTNEQLKHLKKKNQALLDTYSPFQQSHRQLSYKNSPISTFSQYLNKNQQTTTFSSLFQRSQKLQQNDFVLGGPECYIISGIDVLYTLNYKKKSDDPPTNFLTYHKNYYLVEANKAKKQAKTEHIKQQGLYDQLQQVHNHSTHKTLASSSEGSSFFQSESNLNKVSISSNHSKEGLKYQILIHENSEKKNNNNHQREYDNKNNIARGDYTEQ